MLLVKASITITVSHTPDKIMLQNDLGFIIVKHKFWGILIPPILVAGFALASFQVTCVKLNIQVLFPFCNFKRVKTWQQDC